MPREAEHLGDGAYVRQDELDPTMIWLWADRDGIRHEVAISLQYWRRLTQFVDRVWPKQP